MTVNGVDADRYDNTGRERSGSGEHHSGQVRMAYRMAAQYADQLLHVRGIGWHHFDGTRWAEDDRGHARRAVLDILSTALAESIGDKTLRADVAKCESDSGISGVLGVAASLVEFAATVADLDADPGLLNTANGTLDLGTMSLRPHQPRDRITKVTRAAFHPDADSTVWECFLARVLPDPEERAYLQRVVGQALYGRVTEHLLPVLIGTGANGKSTFNSAVTAALGDYATVVDPSLLMAHDRGRGAGGSELMQLLGARLVIGSETEEGRKLDEPTMKRLTGGDVLTGRRLYREPITWSPTHSLLYVTNHLPAVRGNDPAVWRRVRVVPFEVVIPADDRDPDLSQRLELHADAVLSWALSGYVDYRAGGMRDPASVLRATDDYRNESDAVQRFIIDACHVSVGSAATTRELYATWQRWAIRDGSEPGSERAFGKELDRLGYAANRTKRGMTRMGLMPYAEDHDDMGGVGR